jgi:oligogalacturonide lyase
MTRPSWFSFLILACTSLPLLASDVGKDWGVEKQSWIDPITGVRVWEMTANKGEANTLYFHFPNFTRDSRYLLFTSNRTGTNQIYRMSIPEGRIVQLTDSPGVGGLVPDHTNARRIYYQRRPDIVALDVEDFSERLVGTVPGGGGLSLSGDGKWLTLSRRVDPKTSEIGLLSTETGQYKTVIRVGFRIGHIQHSPTEPLIFFVWETGGYAPQRSWLVNTDGTGLRPFYQRVDRKDWFTPLKEWLTHEAWIMGTGEMTMVNDRVGMVIVNTNGTSRLVREGRYWHGEARPDGKFMVMDDFDGRVWLTETATGNARVLATGLRNPKGVHLHPSFDWSGRYVIFNTTKNHRAVGLIDLNDLPAQNWH